MSIAAKNSYFSLDGSDISGNCEDLSFSRAVATAEVQGFGDDNVALIAALESGSISGTVTWDSTVDATLNGLFDSASVAWIYGPAGSTSGLVKYSGNAFVTASEISSDVAGKVSATFELAVTGSVTRGTFS